MTTNSILHMPRKALVSNLHSEDHATKKQGYKYANEGLQVIASILTLFITLVTHSQDHLSSLNKAHASSVEPYTL